jgi:hypothetical protein
MSMCSNCSVFNSTWGAKKGVACKRDAYVITESNRRLVVPRPRNLREQVRNLQVLVQPPEPPGKSQNLRTLVATSLNSQHKQDITQHIKELAIG